MKNLFANVLVVFLGSACITPAVMAAPQAKDLKVVFKCEPAPSSSTPNTAPAKTIEVKASDIGGGEFDEVPVGTAGVSFVTMGERGLSLQDIYRMSPEGNVSVCTVHDLKVGMTLYTTDSVWTAPSNTYYESSRLIGVLRYNCKVLSNPLASSVDRP